MTLQLAITSSPGPNDFRDHSSSLFSRAAWYWLTRNFRFSSGNRPLASLTASVYSPPLAVGGICPFAGPDAAHRLAVRPENRLTVRLQRARLVPATIGVSAPSGFANDKLDVQRLVGRLERRPVQRQRPEPDDLAGLVHRLVGRQVRDVDRRGEFQLLAQFGFGAVDPLGLHLEIQVAVRRERQRRRQLDVTSPAVSKLVFSDTSLLASILDRDS